MDILNNDVRVPLGNTQSLPLEDALAAHAHDALVRPDLERRARRVVVLTLHPGAVVAGVLDPGLSSGSAALAGCRVGAATFAFCCALCAGEVPRPV